MPANAYIRRGLPSSAWTPERVGPLPACVLLVLTGLFAMHGLADHGMPTDIAPMASTMSSRAPDGLAVRHHHMAGEPTAGQVTSEGIANTAGPPGKPSLAQSDPTAALMLGSTAALALAPHGTSHQGHGNHMATGLCLAMLAGMILGLAAWMSAQRRRPAIEHPLRRIPSTQPRGRD